MVRNTSPLTPKLMDKKMKSEQEQDKECGEETLLGLPKAKNWAGTYFYQYQGVWCEPTLFQGLLSFQKHFQAHDSDVMISTYPKSGTTWLKALTYSIVNRTLHHPLMINSPLLSSNPHKLVPFIEFDLYLNDPSPPLHDLPSPRIFGTHVPFHMFPSSVHDSKSRIIYLCRNPFDQFISHYMFCRNITTFSGTDTTPTAHTTTLSEAFDLFCEGVIFMGPPWDHALGYWKMSLERPDKVLFIKYEDLKDDVVCWTKRVAEFLGLPFTEEEEARGVVEDVVKLCSFDTLKGFEVNKTGEHQFGIKNNTYFRKGEVGDWANHLSPEMIEREKIVEEKLGGSGLSFNFKRV